MTMSAVFESEHYRVVKRKKGKKWVFEIRAKLDDHLIFEYTDEGLQKAKDYSKWLESIRPIFA